MNFEALIFEPMINLTEPLLVYFAIVVIFDYIRTFMFSDR